MHIPDGYLSPSTCAVAYAAALPFWHVALKRVQRQLQSRLIPVLAVVSAFCFVIMMFNLPIPGGTTAHAVGIGVAVVVLGPSAAILAISIALMIQALFFGDGGITTFGANCLNMAIIGPLVAYVCYRLVAGRAPIEAPRRAVAAAIAGYVGINASALLTALEFGIQPLLFHDASGTPLYAPYPLSVAVPAMMLAHLTITGAAEAIIAAGVVAYLQRANPDLLRSTAIARDAGPNLPAARGWHGVRQLWIGVGALMVLSPLGLIAAGYAWGEWRADDFQNPAVREQITHASSNMAPPTHVPLGLAHLSTIWHAPMPGYAPAFMHSASFAYILSAVVGAGLIVLVLSGLSWLLGRRTPSGESQA